MTNLTANEIDALPAIPENFTIKSPNKWTFHYVKNTRLSLPSYWVLEIKFDPRTILNEHKTFAVNYQKLLLSDVHLQAQNELANTIRSMLSPLFVCTQRLNTIILMIRKHGHVWINRKGGLTFNNGRYEILATRTKKKLVFPMRTPKEVEPVSKKGKEKITISRYIAGNHYYYLTFSNRKRVFKKNKFNSFSEAYAEAQKYTDDISSGHKNLYATSGD